MPGPEPLPADAQQALIQQNSSVSIHHLRECAGLASSGVWPWGPQRDQMGTSARQGCTIQAASPTAPVFQEPGDVDFYMDPPEV